MPGVTKFDSPRRGSLQMTALISSTSEQSSSPRRSPHSPTRFPKQPADQQAVLPYKHATKPARDDNSLLAIPDNPNATKRVSSDTIDCFLARYQDSRTNTPTPSTTAQSPAPEVIDTGFFNFNFTDPPSPEKEIVMPTTPPVGYRAFPTPSQRSFQAADLLRLRENGRLSQHDRQRSSEARRESRTGLRVRPSGSNNNSPTTLKVSTALPTNTLHQNLTRQLRSASPQEQPDQPAASRTLQRTRAPAPRPVHRKPLPPNSMHRSTSSDQSLSSGPKTPTQSDFSTPIKTDPVHAITSPSPSPAGTTIITRITPPSSPPSAPTTANTASTHSPASILTFTSPFPDLSLSSPTTATFHPSSLQSLQDQPSISAWDSDDDDDDEGDEKTKLVRYFKRGFDSAARKKSQMFVAREKSTDIGTERESQRYKRWRERERSGSALSQATTSRTASTALSTTPLGAGISIVESEDVKATDTRTRAGSARWGRQRGTRKDVVGDERRGRGRACTMPSWLCCGTRDDP